MVDVAVEFFGTLRKRHGERRVITLVTGTLSSLLQQLPDANDVVPDVSWKSGGIDARSDLLILVNGVEVSVYNGCDPKLKHGDVVTLIPVAHGG
jgi:molybdopterin converting factor small subunit